MSDCESCLSKFKIIFISHHTEWERYPILKYMSESLSDQDGTWYFLLYIWATETIEKIFRINIFCVLFQGYPSAKLTKIHDQVLNSYENEFEKKNDYLFITIIKMFIYFLQARLNGFMLFYC